MFYFLVGEDSVISIRTSDAEIKYTQFYYVYLTEFPTFVIREWEIRIYICSFIAITKYYEVQYFVIPQNR